MFRSKADWWLMLWLVVAPAWPAAAQWIKRGSPTPAFWVCIGVYAFFWLALIPIRYMIEDRTVSVKCGLIGWEYAAFSVDEIRSIKPSRTILSAPALSIDRIAIELGMREIVISPKDKAGFLRAVGMLQPRFVSGHDLIVQHLG